MLSSSNRSETRKLEQKIKSLKAELKRQLNKQINSLKESYDIFIDNALDQFARKLSNGQNPGLNQNKKEQNIKAPHVKDSLLIDNEISLKNQDIAKNEILQQQQELQVSDSLPVNQSPILNETEMKEISLIPSLSQVQFQHANILNHIVEEKQQINNQGQMESQFHETSVKNSKISHEAIIQNSQIEHTQQEGFKQKVNHKQFTFILKQNELSKIHFQNQPLNQPIQNKKPDQGPFDMIQSTQDEEYSLDLREIMSLQGQFDSISQVPQGPPKNQDQQNRTFFEKQTIYEQVGKLIQKNLSWLKNIKSANNKFSYSFDLRTLERAFVQNQKTFTQILGDQQFQDRTKISQFLKFYEKNQKYMKSIFIIKQIVLTFFKDTSPFNRILGLDWMNLQKIQLRTQERYFDGLEKQQIQIFLKLANQRSRNSQNMKIIISVNLLFVDMIEAISKMKLDCKLQIQIQTLTKETYNKLKQTKFESGDEINIKYCLPENLNSKNNKKKEKKYIYLNLGVLKQMGNQYDSEIKDIYDFSMEDIRKKSKKIRQLYLEKYKHQQNEKVLYYKALQKELFTLYNLGFSLKLVHHMDCANLIDSFQWPQVKNISLCQFTNLYTEIKPFFTISQLTKQRLEKFPNLESIYIDIIELNARQRTSSLTDVKIIIRQSTVKHIFDLIKQFKNVKFLFCDSKAKWGKFELPVQVFDSYEKLKRYFQRYQQGQRITVTDKVPVEKPKKVETLQNPFQKLNRNSYFQTYDIQSSYR